MVAKSLIVIVGETASGKSSLALELAKSINGEIICADSWSVYREFNIGTAKPIATERQSIEHHLLDVANPADGFNAAQFKLLAEAAIEDILNRGKIPILVGGTGLYIDSVIYNYSFLPAGANKQRAELNSKTLDELREIIKSKKIETAGIDINNKRRVIRLIENEGVRPTKAKLREHTFVVGLEIGKDELVDRVESRVQNMIDNGLEAEVKQLSEKYGWEIEPMKGIGYREFKDMFSGIKSIDEVREDINRNTLKLAKKQRTWFKRNKDINWVDNAEVAQQLVNNWLKKGKG